MCIRDRLGNPKYNVTRGEIWFQGKNITEEPVNERAKMGLFLSFQNPLEVPEMCIRDRCPNLYCIYEDLLFKK